MGMEDAVKNLVEKAQDLAQNLPIRKAPSALTDSAVRKLAQRKGYRLRKKYRKDRYWLESSTGEKTVANEHCVDPDDCLFTKYQVVEYLRAEPAQD